MTIYERQNRLIGVMLVIAAILAAAFLTIFVGHAHAQTQRDAPTTRFYDSGGNPTGSASTYGNQTKFYDARGNHVGTATHNRGR